MNKETNSFLYIIFGISLQSNETHVMQLTDHVSYCLLFLVTDFKRKSVLWNTKMDEGALNSYCLTLYIFLRENNLNLREPIELLCMEHLSCTYFSYSSKSTLPRKFSNKNGL